MKSSCGSFTDTESTKWRYKCTYNSNLMATHSGEGNAGERKVQLIGLPIKTLGSADGVGTVVTAVMWPCSNCHFTVRHDQDMT